MERFKDLIGQIGVFMICAQAVVHFRPKEAYGKYLRLLLGVMVLVQLLSPVYELFWGGEGKNMEKTIRGFQEELEANLGEAAERSAVSNLRMEDVSMKMLEEVWEQSNEGEIGESAGRVVVVEEKTGDAEASGVEEKDGAEVAEVEIKIAPIKMTEGKP